MIFLVYHKILPQPKETTYAISLSRFENHINMIKKKNIPILNPRELSFKGKEGVIFTFDDGTEDHFSIVCPILKNFKIHGLFYVPTSKIDTPGYLATAQILKMFEEGHLIGSHGHSYTPLTKLSFESVKNELSISKKILENLLKIHIDHFAPPGGLYNDMVQKVAKELGFKFLRTMRWGYNKNFNPLAIEIIPMVPYWGDLFLSFALQNKYGLIFKSFFYLKKVLKIISSRFYFYLRSKIS